MSDSESKAKSLAIAYSVQKKNKAKALKSAPFEHKDIKQGPPENYPSIAKAILAKKKKKLNESEASPEDDLSDLDDLDLYSNLLDADLDEKQEKEMDPKKDMLMKIRQKLKAKKGL